MQRVGALDRTTTTSVLRVIFMSWLALVVVAGVLSPVVLDVAPATATGTCTSSPGDAYGALVCSDAPVGYWRLDDITCGSPPCTVIDETGSNDGIAEGTAALEENPLVGDGTAANFGTGGDIRIPAVGNASGVLAPDDFTIEGWIYDDGDSSSSSHILEGPGFDLALFESGGLLEIQELFAIPGAVSSPYIIHNEYAATGVGMHHVVVTKDLDAMTLYVDGARFAVWGLFSLVDAIPTNGTHTGYNTSAPLHITGASSTGGVVIDEVALYDYALTSEQVQNHYYANPNWSAFGDYSRSGGGGSYSDCDIDAQDGAYPIGLPTGEFWHRFDDFSFPGRGVPLALNHTYSSLRAAHDGPLGYGWTMSYDMHLQEHLSGDVTIHEEGGTELDFAVDGGSYNAIDPACPTSLVKNLDDSWTFTRTSTNQIIDFNPAGKLIRLASLVGDPDATTTFAYDGNGDLETATDDAGRTLSFVWDGGHLMDVTDSSSPARSVHFDYDGGDLVGWTDVADGTWAFTYDSHFLVTMRDPNQEGEIDPPVITNHYDGSDRVDSQTDRLDRETTYDYDTIPGGVIVTDPVGDKVATGYSNGVLIWETRGYDTPAAATTRYLRDPITGQVTQVVDPNGNTTSMTYDAAGNITSRTDPLLRQTYIEYNEFGQPVDITDPMENDTYFEYDEHGNLLSKDQTDYTVDPPLDVLTQYSYEDVEHPSDVTSITDPNGKVWDYAYDAYGNRSSITDPLGNVTTFAVNPQGWLTSSVSPRGNALGATPEDFETEYTHTPFGDVHTVTDPLGGVTTKEYDANRNLVSVENPNTNVTTYVHDAEDQLREIHRPDSSVLENEYWDNGRLKTRIDGADAETGYAYDTVGRLESVTDPLNRTTSYRYDAAGNLLAKQDPGGNCDSPPETACTMFTYNVANELTSITYSNGVTPNVTSITYDLNGRKTELVAVNATSTWSYNDLGWLSGSDDGADAVTYGYDANGHVTAITYPGDHTVAREYDDAGRLHTSTDWNTNTTTFDYDEDSDLETVTFPAGSQVDTYTYDEAGRMDTVSMAAGVNIRGALDYDRDDKGQVTGEDLTTLPGSDRTWAYDTVERLTDRDNATVWAYDNADNLTRTSAGDHQVFDAANQLCSTASTAGTCNSPAGGATTYDYDSLGNRITKTPPAPASPTTYGYDQANRLTSIDTADATYTYNGDGLRIAKTVTSNDTTYVWDKAAPMPVLLTEDTEGDTTYFLYGPDDVAYAQIADDTTTTSYLHHDQLGSIRLVTDASGATTGAATYDAYGSVDASSGTTSHLAYAGQYTDAESGLQYLRSRYYDPDSGQFTTVDPAISATRSAHLYAGLSPLNADDPSGLCFELISDELPFCHSVSQRANGLGMTKLRFGSPQYRPNRSLPEGISRWEFRVNTPHKEALQTLSMVISNATSGATHPADDAKHAGSAHASVQARSGDRIEWHGSATYLIDSPDGPILYTETFRGRCIVE